MCTWLKKKGLISLVFSPPRTPLCALQLQTFKMRVLDWICFVSSSLGIWHWHYPEEGCFQLPKRWGFATGGRELGAPRCSGLALLHLLGAAPTPQNAAPQPQQGCRAAPGTPGHECVLAQAPEQSKALPLRSRRAAGRLHSSSLGTASSREQEEQKIPVP